MKYAKSVLCGMMLVSSVSIANATLVLYYDFEGDTLDNKASAATTHDGTVLLGSTVYSADTPAAGGSTSLNLTGNDLLQVNNSASGDSGYQDTFDNLSAMTMAFFMKTDTLNPNNWDNFGNKGGDTGYQIRRFSTTNRSRAGVNGGTIGTEITSGPSIVFNDNVWHHYAITWDGATLVYYVDGNSMGSLAIASMNDVPALPLLFGAQNTSGFRQTDGLYDEIRFYDNALTQSEVQALMIPEPGHFAALFSALIVGAALIRRRHKNNG